LTGKSEEATVKLIADTLKIDRSSASQEVQTGLRRGYLKDLDGGKRGFAHRYALGDSLPEDIRIFPTPETLKERCASMHTPAHRDHNEK